MSVYKEKPGCVTLNLSALKFDIEPTPGSPNLVESGAVAEAIGNLGKPLQWKGPATVAELNAGITGIQSGWTYTLTDSGTLTDGSIEVEPGDEVAWTEDGEWFKVGGENSNVALFQFTGTDYPDGDEVLAEQNKGKTVVLVKITNGYGGVTYDYYYMDRRVSGNIGGVSATQLEFYPADNSKKYIKAYKDLGAVEPTWVWSLEDTNVTKNIGNIELTILKNCVPPDNTLRFKFENLNFSPIEIATSGTWKKVSSTNLNNIWDWTNTNSSWQGEFLNKLILNAVGKVSIIAAGDTSSVVNIRSLFQNCTGLTHVEKFNTQNVSTMYWAFANCSNLTDVPLLDTGKVSTMYQAFIECRLVKSGALGLYNKASAQTTPPSITTDCFKNCGVDTETGVVELEQIPTTWGGTMSNP